jgi:hypothetical protein
MKKTLLLALSLILWASLSWGATYTVCASGCDQTTIQGALDAYDLAGNDVVEVRAASPGATATFRETVTWGSNDSGTAGNPVTLQGRAGDTIIISGSDLIATWTQVGATNVYQAACNWAAAILYEDATRRTFKAWNTNIATTNLAVGEWTLDTTGDLVYVWASDGADPDTHTMEIGVRDAVINTNNQTYLTFDGLTLRDANSSYNFKPGSLTVTGIILKNCTIERGHYNGVDLRGSTTATDIIIDNCIIRNNGGFGIWVDNAYDSGTISNNTIYGNGIDSVPHAQQYSGIQGYLGNFNIYGNTIYSNTATGQGGVGYSHGIYALVSTVVANIYQNTIYSHAMGDGIKLIGSANVYRNKIYSNVNNGIQCGQNGVTNVVYSIYYNVIYSNGTSGSGILESTKGAGTLSLSIYNNLVWKNGGDAQQEIKVTDDVTVLNIKNNILNATDTRRTIWMLAQTGTVAINNNLHWRTDGDPAIYFAGGVHTWAQWQGHGYDANGVNADPLFVSSATGDFRLLSTSPALNVGDTTLGLTRDYIGYPVPQGAAPEMGAYEYNLTTYGLGGTMGGVSQ